MSQRSGVGVSLQAALLGLVGLVLIVAVVPGGAVLERRLGAALEDKARSDLALAPQVLADRWAASVDVHMMHAKDLSGVDGLAGAMASGDSAGAVRLVAGVRAAPLEEPVLISAEGATWAGVAATVALLDGTRRGEMPVSVVTQGARLSVLALAPVMDGEAWVGAAGVVTPVDDAWAGTLSGLTASHVLVFGPDGALAARSQSPELTEGLAESVAPAGGADVEEVHTPGGRFLVVRGSLDAKVTVVFARDLDRELAILPDLRRIGGVTLAVALAFALLVGALFAGRLARPVRSLASAAEGFARGDPDTPLPTSRVNEVRQVADAFAAMRVALATRLEELQAANAELKDRQDRLSVLQAELMQRDRLAAAGSLLAQLAHEIRNPVASVRNCLEVLRRRADDDPEAREFADMAIDELLRMHELTEQMMDLHRPRDPNAHCDAAAVAREVATLTRAGEPVGSTLETSVSVRAPGDVAMSADALKQVLLNLTRNAAEAMGHEGAVEIDVRGGPDSVVIRVLDDGPGIVADVLPRIFDPFFTTKDTLQGVGLGLFTAEGLVRTYGGRISAANRDDGVGACFRVEVPAAGAAANVGGTSVGVAPGGGSRA